MDEIECHGPQKAHIECSITEGRISRVNSHDIRPSVVRSLLLNPTRTRISSVTGLRIYFGVRSEGLRSDGRSWGPRPKRTRRGGREATGRALMVRTPVNVKSGLGPIFSSRSHASITSSQNGPPQPGPSNPKIVHKTDRSANDCRRTFTPVEKL